MLIIFNSPQQVGCHLSGLQADRTIKESRKFNAIFNKKASKFDLFQPEDDGFELDIARSLDQAGGALSQFVCVPAGVRALWLFQARLVTRLLRCC